MKTLHPLNASIAGRQSQRNHERCKKSGTFRNNNILSFKRKTERSLLLTSIAGHGGLNGERPGVDATGEIDDVIKTFLHQPLGGVSRSHAMMAIENDRTLFTRQSLEGGPGKTGEWNKLRL